MWIIRMTSLFRQRLLVLNLCWDRPRDRPIDTDCKMVHGWPIKIPDHKLQNRNACTRWALYLKNQASKQGKQNLDLLKFWNLKILVCCWDFKLKLSMWPQLLKMFNLYIATGGLRSSHYRFSARGTIAPSLAILQPFMIYVQHWSLSHDYLEFHWSMFSDTCHMASLESFQSLTDPSDQGPGWKLSLCKLGLGTVLIFLVVLIFKVVFIF